MTGNPYHGCAVGLKILIMIVCPESGFGADVGSAQSSLRVSARGYMGSSAKPMFTVVVGEDRVMLQVTLSSRHRAASVTLDCPACESSHKLNPS